MCASHFLLPVSLNYLEGGSTFEHFKEISTVETIVAAICIGNVIDHSDYHSAAGNSKEHKCHGSISTPSAICVCMRNCPCLVYLPGWRIGLRPELCLMSLGSAPSLIFRVWPGPTLAIHYRCGISQTFDLNCCAECISFFAYFPLLLKRLPQTRYALY